MRIPSKAEWVFALRSGYYKQCKNIQYDGNGSHCVIGVLMDLAGIKPNVESKEQHIVLDAIGQSSGSGYIYPADFLARKNNDGEAFEALANYIEANLPEWPCDEEKVKDEPKMVKAHS